MRAVCERDRGIPRKPQSWAVSRLLTPGYTSGGIGIMDIEKSKIQEITRLHEGIVSSLKRSLIDGIKIGELLTEQKRTLKHGDFTPWVKDNLPFTDRTARNYMRLFRERDRLKTETVSDLTGAYNMLAEPKHPAMDWDPDTWRKLIHKVNTTFLRHEEKYQVEMEPGKIYELFRKNDDGSMTEREKLGFALWVNYVTHLCYFTNMGCLHGKENLSQGLRQYLEAMHEDKPNWEQEPMSLICREGCQFYQEV